MTPEQLTRIERQHASFLLADDPIPELCAALREAWGHRDAAEDRYLAAVDERDDLNVKLGEEIAALRERIADLEREAIEDHEMIKRYIDVIEKMERR